MHKCVFSRLGALKNWHEIVCIVIIANKIITDSAFYCEIIKKVLHFLDNVKIIKHSVL